MFRGATLGVVFLGCLYVAGFLYKIGFFGVITLETSWLRMVEIDYLYTGVYAVFVSSGMAGVHVIMLIMAYAVALSYAYKAFAYSQKNIGYLFSSRIKKEVSKGFSFLLVVVLYYVATLMVIGLSGKISSKVVALGEKEGIQFFNSERSDRLCNHVTKECYEGKLLYTNNSSYIFFVDAEDGDITHGKIKVAEQRHADVEVGWHEKSVERYLDHN
ncbi:hypothetical protein L0636_07680 [Halomonas janggokensis]|uniref:hypothetical protein n=1 Tax=Vreelandella janggokensis TaxID=370767 RepID=UPI0022A7BCD3|nr:hypothetical protein [Halomonas janggokensis]MCZ0930303.1 hypothetical protein [Halomonas janggokensis]